MNVSVMLPGNLLKYCVCFLALPLLLVSCKQQPNSGLQEVSVSKTLTIYCESSMVPFVMELKPAFEQKYHCQIKVVNDCSQNLIGLINYSRQGDLFIPDSQSSLRMLQNRSSVHLTDSVFIGYNYLTMIVKQGNPLNLSGNLNELSGKNISVIMANPETSSLGLETKKMLLEEKIYQDVLKNVIALSIDSKGLIKSISAGEADVAINWESEMFQNQNQMRIDSVELTNEYATEIYASILSCTQNPDLAKYFIEFVSSEDGSVVTKRFGFNKRKTQVF